jgi:hypothetical protein
VFPNPFIGQIVNLDSFIMETKSLSVFLEKQGYSLDEIMLLIILKEFRFLKKLNYDTYTSNKQAYEVQVVLYSKSKPSIHFVWSMDGLFNVYLKENRFFNQRKTFCEELLEGVSSDIVLPKQIEFSLMQTLISEYAKLFEKYILTSL